MELQTLRNFIEIADHGSITAAARTLGISQPGLSRQLKDLEKELGVKLLVRGNRRVTLTEDGTYLLNRARELTAIAERTKNNLQSKHALGGDLYIGAGETSGKRLVLHVAQELRHQYPSLHVHVTYGSDEGWWPILRPACMISYCDLASSRRSMKVCYCQFVMLGVF